jgi:hypothetical protein
MKTKRRPDAAAGVSPVASVIRKRSGPWDARLRHAADPATRTRATTAAASLSVARMLPYDQNEVTTRATSSAQESIDATALGSGAGAVAEGGATARWKPQPLGQAGNAEMRAAPAVNSATRLRRQTVLSAFAFIPTSFTDEGGAAQGIS